MKADRTIDKYKDRLVIKGYRQKEGLDYFDTYYPVTRINFLFYIYLFYIIGTKRDLANKKYYNSK